MNPRMGLRKKRPRASLGKSKKMEDKRRRKKQRHLRTPGVLGIGCVKAPKKSSASRTDPFADCERPFEATRGPPRYSLVLL